jgi:hypothetical protein
MNVRSDLDSWWQRHRRHNPTARVMFRAGGTSITSSSLIAATSGPIVNVVDISEFQPEINDATYAKWSKAAIIRAMYGDQHDDKAWYGGQRREFLHQAGMQFLGIYQYIVAAQDPVEQANAFIDLVGKIQLNEVYVADIEEGSGDLQETWQLWADTIHGAVDFAPWDYSGLDFAAAHGLQPVDWVADYTSTEPTVPHKLWQRTSSYNVPGVGIADLSQFNGTIEQLASYTYQGKKPTPTPAPTPTTTTWQETLVATIDPPTVGQGATGEVARTVQGLCVARGHTVTVDGNFGPDTKAAVQAVQSSGKLTTDGVVGPKTWPVLLGK